MPQASESPASAMLKRCSAVVASLQASDSSENSLTPVGGQCKGILRPAVQPLRSQTTTPLLPAVHGLDVAAQPQRQRTSVLEQLLTHGKWSLSLCVVFHHSQCSLLCWTCTDVCRQQQWWLFCTRSVKHWSAVTLVMQNRVMGLSATADQMVLAPSLSCDWKWPCIEPVMTFWCSFV